MNISAKELANLVHVSPATVSMVFNNKPGISESTRELVLKTAREYGYKLKDPSTCEAESGVIQLICYKKHGKIAAELCITRIIFLRKHGYLETTREFKQR